MHGFASIDRRNFLKALVSSGVAFRFAGCVSPLQGRACGVHGAVLHVKDLSGVLDWPKLAHEVGIDTLATHVFPEDVIPFMQSEKGRKFVEDCARYGIGVEHEMHAIEYLLPRSLFDTRPELFRLDEKGVRQRKSNGCFTNPETLKIVASRAVEVARICRSTTGRYFYWLSDFGPTCQCPECRRLSPPDQAVLVENAIVEALRKEIDPCATLSHLAYERLMPPPQKVKPHEALFLEYAPVLRYRRNSNVYNREDLVEGGDHLQRLDALLKVFPAESAQVLEYWLDESLYCYYRKPLKRLPWDRDRTRADIAAYARRGIRNFTTFAVWLNAEYTETFGEESLDCVGEYAKLLEEVAG